VSSIDDPTTPYALRVHDVTKTFKVHHERANSLKQYLAAGGRNRYDEFFALRNVSFDVEQGEALGIIGHNGSGKSTLLKCMARILRPNSGSIEVHQKMAALLELGAGFHPDLSGRDNVFLNAAILGMSRPEIARRFDEIVEFSGLEQFIDSPVKTYSSGMYVRLAFAVAINVDPEMLLIDEILAVGDVTFQQRCMEKFVDFRAQGRTLILVTHDTTSVSEFCDRAIWLDHGEIRAEGEPSDIVVQYTETMLGGVATPGVAGVRRGPGPLRVGRVELLADGVATTSVRTGQRLTARLHYDTSEPVSTPVFTVSIAPLGKPIVTAPSTRDAGAVPPTLNGAGVLEFAIDDLSLLPGPHAIHTEVSSFDLQQVYDHVQNAAAFDVLQGDSTETTGMVTMRPTWTFGTDAR